jgi:hypothetical protein
MPNNKVYNINRSISSKKNGLINKIKQMEVPLGAYTLKGIPVSQQSLALYLLPNPRCKIKAMYGTIHKLLDIIKGGDPNVLSVDRVSMTQIHKSKSDTRFVVFDVDDIDVINLNSVFGCINRESVSLVKTNSGFHLLVRLEYINNNFHKTWHKNLTSLLGPDQVGDIMSPIPGCIQGLVVPKFTVIDGKER